MTINTDELLLYKNFEQQSLFDNLVFVINNYESDKQDKSLLAKMLYSCVNELIELANTMGFEGDLWQNFLTLLLASNENAFTTSVEIVGINTCSLTNIALNDYKIFYSLFCFDLSKIEQRLNVNCISLIKQYFGSYDNSNSFNRRIKGMISDLYSNLQQCSGEDDYVVVLTAFYKHYGVGKFGLYKAFKSKNFNNKVEIVPINTTQHVCLDDIVGYEWQKQELIANTESFVNGKKANNVLLYGDSGTGKSTSIKAILNQYYDKGLRMIEIYKHQFGDVPAIIGQIRHRNYKFIIYMDDLSFEESEIEYKYLKALIEGDLETRPSNVLIYTTSNRRHLVKEQFSDRNDMDNDLHRSDTMAEKLSLAERFGISIFYGSPNKREYQNIIKELAKKHELTIEEDKLMLEANRWELSHGAMSGRNAEQFIFHLLGK